MKQFTILLLALSLFSCKQDKEKTYSVVDGTIENNTAENVVIRGTDFEVKIPISPEGKFADTLHLKNDGFYQLFVGRERTEVYLEKGQNLSVSLTIAEFDESLKYSGDLASPNNYLAVKYLWNEQNVDYKELFLLNEEDFINKLDEDQKTLDSLYSTYKITSEKFKKMLGKEEMFSRASLIENYQNAHRYYSGKEDYKVSQNFYESLKDINFKDTLTFRNSVSYQNLMTVHFNRLVSEETDNGENTDRTLLFLKKVDASLPDGY